MNQDSDIKELQKDISYFVQFVRIFDNERSKLAAEIQPSTDSKRRGRFKKQMLIQDFDPVYRRKDFAQIKKNITRRLVMEVVKDKNKHEEMY